MGKHRLEKTILWQQQYLVRKSGTINANETTIAEILTGLMSPHDSLKVIAIRAGFGLGDDPVDESIEWGLGPISISNVQDISPINQPWHLNQNWRSLGTPAQVIQLMERISEPTSGRDLDVEMAHNPSAPNQAMAMLVRSNQGSNIKVSGHVIIEHRIRQFRTAGKMKKVLFLSA